MPGLRSLSVGFAVLFAVLFIGPALLSSQFGPFPLIKVGDVLDLFTPIILIPLYWLLFRAAGADQAGLGASLGFLALAALWVDCNA
jgi:hypothetical protein